MGCATCKEFYTKYHSKIITALAQKESKTLTAEECMALADEAKQELMEG